MATPRLVTTWATWGAATGTMLVPVLLGAGGAASAQEDPTSTTSESSTTAPTAGFVRLDREVVAFGPVVVGQSKTETVTVTAVGGPVEDIAASVDDPFQVDNGCVGIELEAGDSCNLEIRFAPTETGSVSGNLDVESSTDMESAALEGTGTTSSSTSTTSANTSTSTSSPPTDSTTPTTTPETREECDARALRAQVIYPERLRMRVDTSEALEVKASTRTLQTTPSLPDTSTTVVDQPLRCQVRARLVGNEFTINPNDWRNASFLGTDEVSWLWIVTPKVVGDDLLLILEVQGLRFDADTGTYVEAGEAFQTTAEIEVDSKPKGFLTRFNSAVTGVVTHPVFALLASTGLLALVANWAYRRFRGPRPKPNHSATPPGPPGDNAS